MESEVREARGPGTGTAGRDQIRGDVDADDIGAATGSWKRGRSVTAAEVEDLHSRPDVEAGDEIFAAFAHRFGDAGEIPFLPK